MIKGLFLFCVIFFQEKSILKKDSIILPNGEIKYFSIYSNDNLEDFQNADIYNYLKNKKISYIVNGKIIKYKDFDLYSEIKNNNIKKLRKLNNKDSIFNITNSKEYDILLIIETK